MSSVSTAGRGRPCTKPWPSTVSLSPVSSFLPVGQLRIPNERVCTQEFLIQILRGQKKVFKQSEIKPLTVPVTAYLTKDRMAELIADNPALKPYFPDDVAQHSDRQFIVDVVHTIDSNFFILAFDEIQVHLDAKRVKKE